MNTLNILEFINLSLHAPRFMVISSYEPPTSSCIFWGLILDCFFSYSETCIYHCFPCAINEERQIICEYKNNMQAQLPSLLRNIMTYIILIDGNMPLGITSFDIASPFQLLKVFLFLWILFSFGLFFRFDSQILILVSNRLSLLFSLIWLMIHRFILTLGLDHFFFVVNNTLKCLFL